MNAFALSGLLTGITCTGLIVILLVYGKTKLHRIWTLFNLFVAIWGFGAFFIGRSTTEIAGVLSWKFAMSGVIFIPVYFLHTVSIFCGLSRRILILFAYLQGLIFFLLNLFTNFFTGNIRFVFNSFYYTQYTGTSHHIFLLLWIGLVIYGHYKLFKFYKHPSGFKKQEAFYFFLYMAIGFAGGSLNFLPMYKIDIYPFLNFTIPIAPFLVTYAILKHQLMDINIVIKKGLVYSALATLITASYLIFVMLINKLFQGLVGYQSFLVNLFAIFTFAILFIPLRNKIQRFLDRRFFKGTLESLAQEQEQLKDKVYSLEKLGCVGQLASSIAHEIRNPLTAIKTYIEYLPKKENDPEFREKFQRLIPQEIERINDVVDQLLDLARPRALKLINVSLALILDSTLALLENNLKTKKIQVKRNYAEEEITIEADPDQLRQVFLNLFLNALQAMQEGGTLTVETKLLDAGCQIPDASKKQVSGIRHQESSCVEVSISDTGSGISPENLKKLFTPFFTTKQEGTGLGLTIVDEIIRAHKGTIKAESELGKGTTFIIRFPICEVK